VSGPEQRLYVELLLVAIAAFVTLGAVVAGLGVLLGAVVSK
jgi:hypothetical protein